MQVEKTLRKSDLEMYLAGGFNIEAIEYQVENGKNAVRIKYPTRLADMCENILKKHFHYLSLLVLSLLQMPAWGDWLSEEEIQGVAAYVFDQASGDKW